MSSRRGRRVYDHVKPTPMLRYPLLDEWIGCETWVKHENHHATGAFKIRGGVNLVAQLSDEERRRGVVSASTGNHGQSMAYACRVHGVRCHIFVPVGNNPDKVAAMRALGAEVIEYGRDFDEARERVEALAAAGRLAIRALRERAAAHCGRRARMPSRSSTNCRTPTISSCRSAAAAVPRAAASSATAEGMRTKIVGVQAKGADAFARSWRGPVRVNDESVRTCADGIATRTTYDLTFAILKAQLDEVVDVGGGGATGRGSRRDAAHPQPGRTCRSRRARRRATVLTDARRQEGGLRDDRRQYRR